MGGLDWGEGETFIAITGLKMKALNVDVGNTGDNHLSINQLLMAKDVSEAHRVEGRQ